MVNNSTSNDKPSTTFMIEDPVFQYLENDLENGSEGSIEGRRVMLKKFYEESEMFKKKNAGAVVRIIINIS